jgi:hypothetical protein
MDVMSGKSRIAWVEAVGDEPVLNWENCSNPSLTFGEIEHIMDCWYHQPKN